VFPTAHHASQGAVSSRRRSSGRSCQAHGRPGKRARLPALRLRFSVHIVRIRETCDGSRLPGARAGGSGVPLR
jgi:hypothetical protein